MCVSSTAEVRSVPAIIAGIFRRRGLYETVEARARGRRPAKEVEGGGAGRDYGTAPAACPDPCPLGLPKISDS